MSVYNIARNIQLPATETTIVLNPKNLTKRLRNAIVRNLRRGTGYGYGAAAQISLLLASSYGIEYSSRHSVAISRERIAQLSDDDREALRLLVIQDYAEYSMDNEYVSHNTYYQAHHQRQLEACASGAPTSGAPTNNYDVSFYKRHNKTTALKKFIDSAENNANCPNTQEVIDLLNSGERIVLKEYRND